MDEISSRLVSFHEIENYPVHYMNTLIENKQDSFLLFQYGPYLVMEYNDYFMDRIDKISNDSLLLMVLVARVLISARVAGLHSNIVFTFKVGKEQIRKVLSSARGEYSDRIRQIGNKYMESLRKAQYESHSLESALLSSAPIVQYAKTTLVKPEMTKDYEDFFTHKEPTKTYKEMNRLLHDVLYAHIEDVLKEPNAFIHLDHINEDLIRANQSQSEAYKYFVLVFLRYVSKDPENYEENYKKIFNLNNTCNKLSNGERVCVTEALKALDAFPQMTP
jgi:hypothetical protein